MDTSCLDPDLGADERLTWNLLVDKGQSIGENLSLRLVSEKVLS